MTTLDLAPFVALVTDRLDALGESIDAIRSDLAGLRSDLAGHAHPEAATSPKGGRHG